MRNDQEKPIFVIGSDLICPVLRIQHLFKKLPLSLLAILLLAVPLYFYLSFFENALIDDAFITLQYAKTLLASGAWGFSKNHITNSATSPLNVILLALASSVTGSLIDAVKWLAFVNFLIIFILLRRVSIKYLNTETFGILSFVALVCNPLLLSTIGLEGILFTTIFIASLYFYLENRWHLLAVSTGLLTLTRLDGILFFGLFLIFVLPMKLRLRFTLLYLAYLAPWYIFSWIHLGALVPDTFFIKTLQNSWGPWAFFNGVLLYYQAYSLETILSFLYLPLLVLAFNDCLRNLRNVMIIIGGAGLAHFIGYSLLHVPPYHWYYVPQVVATILLGALALTGNYRYCVQSWKKKLLWALVTLYMLIPALGMLYVLGRDGFSLKEMPIHTNWATHEQYREVGLWLKKHNSGEPVRVGREIGTLAFYCDCALLNHFSDRRWLKNYINQRSTDGSIRAALLKINFIFCKDDSDFPPISSVLVEHANRDMLDNPQFIKWETSTKWIPDGLLTYSEGDFNLNQKLRLVNPTGHPYVYTYIWNNGQAETYLLDDTSRRGRTYDVAWTVTPQKILFQGTFQAKQSSFKTLSPGPYLAVAVAFSDSPARVTQHIFERRFWFTFTEDGQIKVFFPPEEWHNPRWPDESGWQMEDIDSVMTDR
jgi:hypothetical protein